MLLICKKFTQDVKNGKELFTLRLVDFLDASLVAAAFEGGFEEGFEDGFEVGFGSEFLRERQHVGVVVEAGQIGHIFVNGQTGADTFDFVDRYVHPIPRPADGDAALGLAIGDETGGFEAEVGIIDGVFGIGAQVEDFVAHFYQYLFDFVFELETGVVGGDGDFHLVISIVLAICAYIY